MHKGSRPHNFDDDVKGAPKCMHMCVQYVCLGDPANVGGSMWESRRRVTDRGDTIRQISQLYSTHACTQWGL